MRNSASEVTDQTDTLVNVNKEAIGRMRGASADQSEDEGIVEPGSNKNATKTKI